MYLKRKNKRRKIIVHGKFEGIIFYIKFYFKKSKTKIPLNSQEGLENFEYYTLIHLQKKINNIEFESFIKILIVFYKIFKS